MPVVILEPGRRYRLRMDLEIRDERTGTLRAFLNKGATVKIKQVDGGSERVWIEGVNAPAPADVFARIVDLVA